MDSSRKSPHPPSFIGSRSGQASGGSPRFPTTNPAADSTCPPGRDVLRGRITRRRARREAAATSAKVVVAERLGELFHTQRDGPHHAAVRGPGGTLAAGFGINGEINTTLTTASRAGGPTRCAVPAGRHSATCFVATQQPPPAGPLTSGPVRHGSDLTGKHPSASSNSVTPLDRTRAEELLVPPGRGPPDPRAGPDYPAVMATPTPRPRTGVPVAGASAEAPRCVEPPVVAWVQPTAGGHCPVRESPFWRLVDHPRKQDARPAANFRSSISRFSAVRVVVGRGIPRSESTVRDKDDVYPPRRS